jgi:HAD superfamily hydrolase (TIGR01509 family)
MIDKPAALIFDLDGTLTDTVEARIQAWLRTFAEIGIPAERKHVAGLIGADGKRLAKEVAAVGGHPIDEDRAEAIDKRSGEIFNEIAADPRPQVGAHELLEALERAGIPWSIATSSRREQAEPMVRALDLPRAPRVTDGSHVKHAKPAPDLLLAAAEQLGVPAFKCLYIGDATWDMRAARAAQMTPIGVASGAVSAETLRQAGAEAAFESLVEVREDLEKRGILAPEPSAG